MVRICIDATSVIHGGRAVRRNSRNLIQGLLALSSRDVEYILFYLDWKGHTAGRVLLPEGAGHREYVCRIPWQIIGKSWNAFAWPGIESMIGKVDLVYGPDLHFPPARHAVTMTTLRGIAYVAVPELCDAGQVHDLNLALNYAKKNSDYFLAVSEHTKMEAARFLSIDPRRIMVSPHGVEPGMHVIRNREHVASVLAERYAIDYPYLLYVGAITHRKNMVALIKAFVSIRHTFRNLHLVLAGAPDNASDEVNRLIAEEELKPNVHLLGNFAPESDDLLYLYNGALMLTYPTLHEGWTAPPLEAMACGIPVVTSDFSSVPETCGGAAHLVDPNSIASIEAGIRQVLSDEEYRDILVKKGLERAGACSWAQSARRMESIFKKLITHGKRWSKTGHYD